MARTKSNGTNTSTATIGFEARRGARMKDEVGMQKEEPGLSLHRSSFLLPTCRRDLHRNFRDAHALAS